MKRSTVLILNHNGLETTIVNKRCLFKECLESVMNSAQICSNNIESIILIDNASNDGSVEYTRETFPEIDIYRLKRNYLMLGYNYAAQKKVKTETFICLANDMVVDRDFFKVALDDFGRNDIAAVKGHVADISYKDKTSFELEKCTVTTLCRENALFSWKRIDISSKENNSSAKIYTFLAGHATAYSTELFLKLGGFSKIFFPFYWEDFDLSYRIWKSGHKIILDRRAFCYTVPYSSFRNRYEKLASRLFIRNKYLSNYVNATEGRHLASLLKDYISELSAYSKQFELQKLLGLLGVIPKLPEAFLERRKRKADQTLSHKEMTETIKKYVGQEMEA